MLKKNVESNEHDAVELTRRNFFSRFAVGAFLTIGAPSVVQAAKSLTIKADKHQRLAQTAKTAVRLPKHSAMQSARASSHHYGGSIKTSSTGGRQHAVFDPKKHNIHPASYHSNNRLHHNDRRSAILQSVEKEPIYKPDSERLFYGNNGRIATHRSLAFQIPQTGDKLSLTYFEKGRYLSDALDEISFLLRDYRTGDVHPIDPELLDQLHDLKQMLGLSQPFDIICGYRSPLTNALLHAEHSGVANNSFHIHGRAVDIRIERFGLRRIHSAALAMHRGGVGYYPESNFIHLDTGTFRTWTL